MTLRTRFAGYPAISQADRLFAEYAQIGGIVTADMHGAVGDGLTDDTAAIRAALQAVGQGNEVTLHPGRTYVTNGLALTGAARTIVGGTSMRFEGTGAGSNPVKSPVTVKGARGDGSGVVAADNTSTWVPLFDLAYLAVGRVTVHAVNGTNYTTEIFDITWTIAASAFTATSRAKVNAGNQDGTALRQNAGMLEARSGFSGSVGATMAIFGHFDGERVL